METENAILHLIADWLLILSIPAVVIFTIMYGVRSRWHSSPAGRAVLYLSASLTTVSIIVGLNLLFGPDWIGRELARLLAYAFVFFANWRLLFVLIETQKIQKREEQRILDECGNPPVSEDPNGPDTEPWQR